jgi:septal ring-binding cell division protein DamX
MFEFGFLKVSHTMVRFTLTLFALLLLQGCGLADRFFVANECEGDNCEAPVLLDNSTPDQKWYCYGRSPDEWQCQNTEDDGQITAIQPKTSEIAVAPLMSPATPAEIESTPPLIMETQEPPPTVREPETRGASDEILDTPADHYAVQLIALREVAGITEYARLNGISEPLYVKIRNDQTDWYILLLGVYSDRALAEAAKRDWQTAKTLRVKPWIRQLGGLQEAIRKANG